MSVDAIISEHEAKGRYVDVDGLRTFVREEGQGDAVVLVHGVPVSGFLYRKVLPELAQRGFRAITYDYAGLGLSARPEDYDYTWTGLGRHLAKLIDTLELDAFHLVVHDIGGPVGFEAAAAHADRVRSLTILNTLIEADEFDRPWSMEPFASKTIGPIWLKSILRPMFRQLMYMQGIADKNASTPDEIDAHRVLLKRGDDGRAFLRIMRGFERTKEKREKYIAVVKDERYPKRVLWGAKDPAITLERWGAAAGRIAGVEVHTVPAKHFLQEDQAPAVAEHVAACAGSSK